MTTFSVPRKLGHDDNLDTFSSGVALIDEWARDRASHAQERRTAVVYVILSDDVSDRIGARALLVDLIDEKAASFYTRYGLKQLPETRRMLLPLV